MSELSCVQPPDGLTCASLKMAKRVEMVFWISQANATAGKRVMTKNGRVEDLRKRLAEYYGLDLLATADATASTSAALKTHEEDIKERQFSWLRELGEEWSSAVADGHEFLLCEGSSELCSASILQEAVKLLAKLTMHTNRHSIAAPLALDGRTQAENNETIAALIGAARAGDLTAISRLSSLGEVAAQLAAQTSTASASGAAALPAIYGLQMLLPILPSTDSSALHAGTQPVVSLPLMLQPDSSMPAVMVTADHCAATLCTSSGPSLAPAPSESPIIPPASGPCMVNDMAVLSSCRLDIESIQRVQGLRDAIEQVESGAVSRVRECYGPKDGRAADEMWGRLKGKITKLSLNTSLSLPDQSVVLCI